MKNRMLALLLVTSFMMCVLVGCDAKKTASTSNESEAPEEEITIELWHKEAGVKKELFQKYVDQFMDENPNVTVVITQTRNDAYKEKLPISFSGNQQPDIFFTWGGSWLQSFVDAGHVMELTGKIGIDNFSKTTLKNAIFDEKLYGVPLGVDIAFVYYNKEIFEKYDIDVPTTFDELLDVNEKLKSNGVTPFVLANQPKWPATFYFMYLVDRIGGIEAFDNAVNRTGSFADPVFVEAGEKLQSLAEANVFNIGFNGIAYDSGPGRQLLYTGQCAMLLMSNTFVNLMRVEAPEFEEKIGIFPFPAVEGGKGDSSSLVGISSPVWSISQATKYPEECIELVELLISKEIGQEYANITGSQSARMDVTSTDSFVNELEEMTQNAKTIQMVYDQTLPSEIIEVHYNTIQELLGLTMTPEEAADAVEAVAKEVYGK